MTNLTSPAAESAVGLPNVTMPDIIDSLKRLERIGSENSKTVAKIIEAAREIEARIVAQYLDRSVVEINPASILRRLAEKRGTSIVEVARALGVPCEGGKSEVDEFSDSMVGYPSPYSIRPFGYGRQLYITNDNTWVGENRDTALTFSKDLAKGLLAVIVEDVSNQQRENEEGLEILKQARQTLQDNSESRTRKSTPINRAVRIQAPSSEFVAWVELNFEVSPGDSLPDRMKGKFIDYGDNKLNELAVQDEGVIMWLNPMDGYRLTMVGPSGSADFSLEHQRINPATGLPGFARR
jgi:hypothetical protein